MGAFHYYLFVLNASYLPLSRICLSQFAHKRTDSSCSPPRHCRGLACRGPRRPRFDRHTLGLSAQKCHCHQPWSRRETRTSSRRWKGAHRLCSGQPILLLVHSVTQSDEENEREIVDTYHYNAGLGAFLPLVEGSDAHSHFDTTAHIQLYLFY